LGKHIETISVYMTNNVSCAARGKIVTIAIGPEKKLYHIHQDLICYHSEYFRAAYNGPWKESDEGVVLEDVEVEVFNIFVHWLYTQTVPGIGEELTDIAESDSMRTEHHYPEIGMLLLLKSCVFGDRFLAPAFKIRAHNLYVEYGCSEICGIKYEQIIYGFDNLPEDTGLLTMMVQLECHGKMYDMEDGTEDEAEMRSKLPRKFLVRVMLYHRERAEWMEEVDANDFYLAEGGEVDPADYYDVTADKDEGGFAQEGWITDYAQA
jgi:hypothetical protein